MIITALEKWAKNLCREDILSALTEINPNFQISIRKRIYSLSLDINQENLPTKGEILVAELSRINIFSKINRFSHRWQWISEANHSLKDF
jgi:hypothetical protein